MLESSRATNCPMITYQLVGTKKVQQVLASKEILEKYAIVSSHCLSSIYMYMNIHVMLLYLVRNPRKYDIELIK